MFAPGRSDVQHVSRLLILVCGLLAWTDAPAVEFPRVLDPNWQIELIASEPELVTPVGCCLDEKGRLLVIESHTHFPPEQYQGPKQDRIYLFDDSNGDGVLDRQRLFYEGGTATMGLCRLDDGWIAVASRSEVIRIRDSDDDDVADQREVLVSLRTKQTYPHNGLTGITLGNDGWLYLGQGENLGDPYELVAADGSKQIGGGEGGNLFRCRPDGKELQRYATGLWNPFGMCFDTSNRFWVVGNDPDAMPPCRLLQIVPTGDYGFQFRFGRAGTHPLQAWNGELPGTLPMVAGTGEAPCDVVPVDDSLWVTSWGDNRIEAYTLVPQGASWTSQTEVVVQGGANFRPVGIAVAQDDSIYVTDWVDRSYPVHGKGRLWRLTRKNGSPIHTRSLPDRTAQEEALVRLQVDDSLTTEQRLSALEDSDPLVRQAAIAGLIQTQQLHAIDQSQADSPWQRVGLLTAWRWLELASPDLLTASKRHEWIAWGLQDQSEVVRLTATRWATERRLQEHLDTIQKQLERPDLSPRMFAAVIASIAFLESGTAAGGQRDPGREQLLYQYAANEAKPAVNRGLALRMLPPESEAPASKEIGVWLARERSRDFGIEGVRLLALRSDPTSLEVLASIATNESIPSQTRADAVASLAPVAAQFSSLLNQLASPRQAPEIREEIRRMTQRTIVNRQVDRPPHGDLDAWSKLVAVGGDRDAGRRVFFRTTCANCHAHNGRGAKTGPDLSTLGGQMTIPRLMESILYPSKEIGPLYVPWRVITTDGRILTGLKLDASGVGRSIKFQGADGMIFEVPLSEIEQQEPIAQSIMPTGLEETMSIQELRDLTAFLIESPSAP